MKRFVLTTLALALSLLASGAGTTITLGWNESPPEEMVTDYLVYQRHADEDDYSLVGSVNTNMITISNLDDGMYFFTVVAKNLRGTSIPSNPFVLPTIATKITNVYAVIHIELKTKLD
jgi:hypothetical protein